MFVKLFQENVRSNDEVSQTKELLGAILRTTQTQDSFIQRLNVSSLKKTRSRYSNAKRRCPNYGQMFDYYGEPVFEDE